VPKTEQLLMKDVDSSQNTASQSQTKYLNKFLIIAETFSQTITYLVFALICIEMLLKNTPELSKEFIVPLILLLFSGSMFIVFTFFMFSPERSEKFRNNLMYRYASDSKIKTISVFVLFIVVWAMLFIVFLDGLIQGSSRIPENLRQMTLLIGLIWLILIPLSSIIKLSVFDGRIYWNFTKLWKRGNDKADKSTDTSENDLVKSMFKPDQPIQSYKEDLLDRASFARSLGDAILKYEQKDSIVLGLLGTWGSGKTSVVNMALEHIDHVYKDSTDKIGPLVLKFNPWNYADQDQLIRQFFRQLSITLRRSDYGANAEKIGEIVEKYASLLDPLTCIPNYSLITTIFAGVLRFFGQSLSRWGNLKSNDLNSIKSELNELLDKQERKIIIIIDDIDRLNDTEIRQIFQLVKSLGDFHNTIYILPFDKKVAVSALDRVQESFGLEYLEKVVQVPLEVPLIHKREVDKLLFSQIDTLINEVQHEKWDSVRWGNIYLDGLTHFFRTIRDVNRYINSLRFSLEMVQKEVDVIDFLAITGLQVFVPEVYYGVRDGKEVFSGILESTSGAGAGPREQIKARCDEVISKTDKYPQEKVKELLKLLFPKLQSIYGNFYYDSQSLGEWRRSGRICSPDTFEVFFRLSIPKDEISKTELEEILSVAGHPDTLADFLLKLEKEGKIIMFLERAEDYTRSAIPEEYIENIVTVLMDTGDIFPEGDTGFLGTDTPMRILRICYQLTHRLDSQEKRFTVIKNAVEKANRSLHTIVQEVSVLGQEQDKYGLKTNKPNNEFTVDAIQLEILENLALSKIKVWAADGRLANHEKLDYILYRWREWDQAANVETYVKDLIRTDNGLINFIASFLSKVFSSGMGSRTSTIHWRISTKNIASFVDINDIEPRLRRILSTDSFAQLDDRKQLAVKTFLDTLDGKIKDPFGDPE